MAVADGVNVDFDVVRLSTKIGSEGSIIEEGTTIKVRNRKTRDVLVVVQRTWCEGFCLDGASGPPKERLESALRTPTRPLVNALRTPPRPTGSPNSDPRGAECA